MLRLRPPVVPPPADNDPTVSTDPRHKVTIHHPGYDSEDDELLTLLAFDRPNGGLHYETAIVICGIIAGNRWDGYLTRDVDGEERDGLGPSDIIPVGDYYYHVKDSYGVSDKSYAVVPTFTDWPFPHANLPPSWQNSSIGCEAPRLPYSLTDVTAALVLRDKGLCRMSLHSEACEKAHICPVSENEWFNSQKLHRYIQDPRNAGDLAICDINNILLLRADLHKSFDDKKFTFLPKDGQIVTHMLWPSCELSLVYHNVIMHQIDSIPPEYLLARLAWSIFPMLRVFLQCNKKRFLVSVSSRNTPYLATAEECKSFGNRKNARSRTNSPTKRAREETLDNVPVDGEPSHIPGDYAQKKHKTNVERQSAECSSSCIGQRQTPLSESSPTSAFILGSKTPPEIRERHRLWRMKEEALLHERARSDTDGRWEKELEWANQYLRVPQAEPCLMERLYDILGTAGE